MLNSPLKTQRNNPFSSKNKPSIKYPIEEVKKDRISFLKIASIVLIQSSFFSKAPCFWFGIK